MTEMLHRAVKERFDHQKQVMTDRYMRGDPVPEEERLAVLRAEAAFEDFFEASAEDVRAALETGK